MAIKSKTVRGRRALAFHTLSDILADAEAMAAAPHRGLGNWSLGQICDHLANLMEQSLDGFAFRVPRLVALGGRLLRGRLLTKPWPAGIRPPRAMAKKIMPPPQVSDEVGLARLRHAIRRLEAEPQRHASPLLGRLTREQWDQFHCRHAELHLSFIVPE